jgi:hypothetical protein
LDRYALSRQTDGQTADRQIYHYIPLLALVPKFLSALNWSCLIVDVVCVNLFEIVLRLYSAALFFVFVEFECFNSCLSICFTLLQESAAKCLDFERHEWASIRTTQKEQHHLAAN